VYFQLREINKDSPLIKSENLSSQKISVNMDYIIANWTYFSGAFLGFAVGILTGLFGAGGGFIITPALNIFLGLPMNLAVGTSACQVLGAASFTFINNFDKRMPGLKLALIIGIGIPLGVIAGTKTVTRLHALGSMTILKKELDAVDFILLLVFVFLLLFIAVWMLIDSLWLRKHHTEEDELTHKGLLTNLKIPPYVKCETIPLKQVSVPLLISTGLLMGFLSGLLGIGGGVIMMPLLFYIIGQQAKFAVRTSVMLILISGFFATISHALAHNIDYKMVAFLIPGAFIGSRIGITIHKRISSKSLRKYFAFIILGAMGMVIIKIIKMLH
jgi:uncharacterized membrane protein YfcA